VGGSAARETDWKARCVSYRMLSSSLKWPASIMRSASSSTRKRRPLISRARASFSNYTRQPAATYIWLKNTPLQEYPTAGRASQPRRRRHVQARAAAFAETCRRRWRRHLRAAGPSSPPGRSHPYSVPPSSCPALLPSLSSRVLSLVMLHPPLPS